MVCTRCGCEQGVAAAQFCRQCGAPMSTPMPGGMPGQMPNPMAPPPPPGMYPFSRTRVANNVQALGILWCVFGAYRIIGGITAAFFLHSFLQGGMFGDTPPFFTHMMGSVGPFVLAVASVMGVLSILTGYGLLTRQPWARTLAIVVGIITLIKPFMGTVLAIYTLWVLAPNASGMEWDSLQNARAGQRT